MISIRSTRSEIADSQEEVPSLNQDFMQSIWQDCFAKAWLDARDEMEEKPLVPTLSWDEVFNQAYELSGINLCLN